MKKKKMIRPGGWSMAKDPTHWAALGTDPPGGHHACVCVEPALRDEGSSASTDDTDYTDKCGKP
jgi:hypothetical protein